MRAVPAVATSLLLAAFAAAAAAAPAAAAQAEPPALVVERGSVAREQVVAVGRGVRVDGEALADVAAIEGAIEVSGRVAGDVIAMGGDVSLAPTARVEGDVFVLGGDLRAAAGAFIGGKSVSYPTASSVWLTLFEGPALGLPPTSPVVLGAKLALLTAWLALVLLFFAANGRELLSTSDAVASEPFRSFAVGLTAILALTLTAVFLSALTGLLVGVPLLVLVALAALVLKLWGMVAVFHALGSWFARRVLRRRVLPLHAASIGLVLMGILKLIPWVGSWTWMVATLVGVGASLTTKLGRREPWFAVEELDRLPPLVAR
jgi:hypothetical protein